MSRPSALALCGSLQRRSVNRGVLAAVSDALRRRAFAVVEGSGHLRALPPFDADAERDPPSVVVEWRASVASADVIVIAAPEYAGSLAGVIKNALDWLVGGGQLYGKVVGIASAGLSGGRYARAELVRTLTWQGAHVVAALSIAGAGAVFRSDGAIADDATAAAVARFADDVADAFEGAVAGRIARAEAVLAEHGVDRDHLNRVDV